MVNGYYPCITTDWSSDVLSLDYYPIGYGDSIRSFRLCVELVHQIALTAGKPTWFWLQSVGYYGGSLYSREPTDAEAECMAYLALIHGSRGLMYFMQKPRLLEQWNELRLLSDEVSTLTPVLSSTNITPTVSTNAPSIHLLSKSYGGWNYVIAVNESPLPVTAVELTSAEADSGLASVLFENRNVNLVDGIITDTFSGYQRHVYSYTAPLVAHWALDETSGNAMDSSGNDHVGTLVNGPTWTGGALSFDASNDYVVADNVGVNTAPGGCNTVAFWMKWNGGNAQMPFGWNGAYDLIFANGAFGINTGEGNYLGISSAGMVGQWVHVAVVFPNGVPSASNAKMFINGVEQTLTDRGNFTTRSKSATSRVFISGWGANSDYKFGGTVDDVRIYNK